MFQTTITSWALLVARAIEDSGLDSQQIFKLAGLDPASLHDPDARYSYSGMTRLWQLATEHTGDPCIGLKAASHWHPTSMHALGYAWMASGTLKDALQRLVRYLHLLSTAVELVLEEDDEVVRLVFPLTKISVPAEQAMDAALAVIVGMCRTSYGNKFRPLEISMRRAEPTCAEEFSAYFCAPVNYSASVDAITFYRQQLEEKLPTANAELARINDQIVMDYLADLDSNNISFQVKSKIIELLPSGNINEECIAQSMNKSLRSLQRKLTEQGVSYKSLLESTREELGKQYISSSKYSISEVAYLLGFSEPGNFSRAFKRWTGQSPSYFRQGNLAG